MELILLMGYAALAALIFMAGVFLVQEASNGIGIFVGMVLMAASTSTFVASMIRFAVDYYIYASAVGAEALLKSLTGG